MFFGFLIQLLSITLSCISTLLNKMYLNEYKTLDILLVLNGVTAFLSLPTIIYQYKKIAKYFFIQMFISLVYSFALFFLLTSIQLLHPTVFGILGRFFVVFSLFFSWLFLNERFGMVEACFILLAILSTLGFYYNQSTFEINQSIQGLMVSIIYSALMAYSYILIKKHYLYSSFFFCDFTE